jgi:hypothetical protein
MDNWNSPVTHIQHLKMRRLILGLLCFSLSWLIACQSREETPQQVDPTMAPKLPIPTLKPVPTLTQTATIQQVIPSQTPQESPLNSEDVHNASTAQKIGFGREFYEIAWSSDSKMLFSGLWAYDIENGTSQELTPESILQPTTQPDILSHLPPGAIDIFLSPNNTHLLYFTLTTPTPTPLPEGMGEAGGPNEMRAIVWSYEQDGEAQDLGEIEYCGYDGPLWINEQKVIFPIWDYLSNCGDTQAWLVDLQKNTLTPFFPREQYPSPVRTYTLSTDGTQLIYGTFGSNNAGESANPLYLLNINDLSIEQLQTPDLAHGEQWLTDKKLLISYRKESQIDLTLGLFDLESSEVNELTPTFNGLCIRFPSVSPNLKWLAFATGKDCDNLNDLWLMSLELNQ